MIYYKLGRTLTYSLRSQTNSARNFVNTSRFGLNSPRYFASIVWNIVPSDIWNLHVFKNKIRKWEPTACHCDLCRPCVSKVKQTPFFFSSDLLICQLDFSVLWPVWVMCSLESCGKSSVLTTFHFVSKFLFLVLFRILCSEQG